VFLCRCFGYLLKNWAFFFNRLVNLVIITAACLFSFSCVTLLIFWAWCHDTQHNDILHNDTQNNGIFCDSDHNDIQHYNSLLLCRISNAECRVLFIVMLNVVKLSVVAPTTVPLEHGWGWGGGLEKNKLLSFPQTIDSGESVCQPLKM
jgi:hypothetical protein